MNLVLDNVKEITKGKATPLPITPSPNAIGQKY